MISRKRFIARLTGKEGKDAQEATVYPLLIAFLAVLLILKVFL